MKCLNFSWHFAVTCSFYLRTSARASFPCLFCTKSVFLFKNGELKVQLLGRGFAWLDTGTYDGLANATDFVRTIQKRTGLNISCLEEIAYLKKFIDKAQLIKQGKFYEKTEYGQYILKLAENE